MSKAIKLGYEVGTGKEVSIELTHLLVTGITQQSGKTTTLEALIKRSNLKAIVFKTKRNEKSFAEGTVIRPFFKEQTDFWFVRMMIEAYMKEKINIEKGTLMQICTDAKNLVEIKHRVDEQIRSGKLRGIMKEIFTRLQYYLNELIPQIKKADFSTKLKLNRGVNVMDIVEFSDELQSLVIQSVAEEVMLNHHEVIIVIPEAWKFLPQKYTTPCKRTVENFIRQGAASGNYVWVDSQEMAGIDKAPLKQISTWILGYQTERNEVKHTLDQISAPKKSKPSIDDIMTLQVGHFYLSTRDKVVKVYVQPLSIEDAEAKLIACGKKSIPKLTPAVKHNFETSPAEKKESPMGKGSVEAMSNNGLSSIKTELREVRNDFWAKIGELWETVDELSAKINGMDVDMPEASHNHETLDIDDIVAKVLQKLPLRSSTSAVPNVEGIVEKVIQEMVKRGIGTGGNAAIYQVAPLEKIKKAFLEEAKKKILNDISNLSTDAKKMLQFVESQGKGVKTNTVVSKCFMLAAGGTSSKKVTSAGRELASIGVVRINSKHYYAALLDRIKQLMGSHSATPDEIQQTYDHILYEMIQ